MCFAFFTQMNFILEGQLTWQEIAFLPLNNFTLSERYRAHRAISAPALNCLTGSGLSGQVNFLALCETLQWPHVLCSWVISTWPHPTGRNFPQWIFSNPLSLVRLHLSICIRDSGTDGGGAGPGVRSTSSPLLPSPGWGGHQRLPIQGWCHPCHKRSAETGGGSSFRMGCVLCQDPLASSLICSIRGQLLSWVNYKKSEYNFFPMDLLSSKFLYKN